MERKESPVFVLRLGDDKPVKGDIAAVTKIREDLDVAGCSIGVGILNLMMTDLTVEEIKGIYKEAAEEVGDFLPIVIWRADQPEHCALDLDIPVVSEMIRIFESNHGPIAGGPARQACTLTLDELLDKISRAGVESLTKEEVARLKSLS